MKPKSEILAYANNIERAHRVISLFYEVIAKMPDLEAKEVKA